MKKAAQSLTLFLGMLAAFFVFVGDVSAASVRSQLLSEAAFTATDLTNYGYVQQALGQFATGTQITGVQLWAGQINSTFSQTVHFCIWRHANQGDFDSDPHFTPLDGKCVNLSPTTDASGFFQIPLTYTFQGGSNFYAFEFGYSSSPESVVTILKGTTISSGGFYLYRSYPPNTATTTNSLYFQLYQNLPDQYFTPDPNFSGFATSTVAETCDDSFSTTTGFLDSVGASISNGFCRVGAFLFVPNANIITQYANLPASLNTKIPFSYYYDFKAILDGSSASSSSNFTPLAINLGATGVGSSSAYAPVLSGLGNFGFLSTTTIMTYISQSTYDLLFLLMRSAIWIAVLFHIYRRFVPKHVTHA